MTTIVMGRPAPAHAGVPRPPLGGCMPGQWIVRLKLRVGRRAAYEVQETIDATMEALGRLVDRHGGEELVETMSVRGWR